MICRLLKAVLLLDTRHGNANINHKDAFLRTLFTKLISPSCSAMVKRAILELYHQLLKDHRQLLEDAEVDSDLDHPAGSVLKLLSTPDLWSLAPNLLKEPLQHATLVLMIDIEKARTRLDTTVSEMMRSVHLCHDAILGCMPQVSLYYIFIHWRFVSCQACICLGTKLWFLCSFLAPLHRPIFSNSLRKAS